MSIHGMCNDEVTDTDRAPLGCMRSPFHWEGRAIPHYDASEDRSWVIQDGVPLIWDGDVRRRQAGEIRQGTRS